MFSKKFITGAAISGIVFLIVLIGGISGFSWIGVGSIGIVKHMNGGVTQIPQGIHWTGWGVSVQEYPTYRQALGGKKGINLRIGSSDQQELLVTTNLNWNIDLSKSETLYQSVGGNDIEYVSDTIVLPTMKNDINKVTHTYGWNDIKGAKQAEVTQEIEKILKSDLAKSGIELVNFGFSNVGSPAGMAQSQQTLASSELAVKQAQATQEKTKIDNATSIMQAQTDAQAKLIKAKGEAQANQVLAQSITPNLIEYNKIQKWNGANPSTVLGSGTTTMVQVK
jgi:regulator of protease activity HflC (stomatin/prohibitin superfamily)